MPLFWPVADWGNKRQLLQVMGDSKRRKHLGDIRGVTEANKLRKFRVKRPNLEFHPLVEDVPPQFALDRHQTRSVCFFLQLIPTVSLVSALQVLLPCNGEVNRMACLPRSVEHREGEVSIQFSFGFELGPGQLEGPGAIARSQHPLHFTP